MQAGGDSGDWPEEGGEGRAWHGEGAGKGKKVEVEMVPDGLQLAGWS